MEFKVSWPALGDKVVMVEAEDRWKAVVGASKLLGLDKAFPMSFLYKEASVKRPGKETLGRPKMGVRYTSREAEQVFRQSGEGLPKEEVKKERRPWWKLF